VPPATRNRYTATGRRRPHTCTSIKTVALLRQRCFNIGTSARHPKNTPVFFCATACCSNITAAWELFKEYT
jgi:hypothetical protein